MSTWVKVTRAGNSAQIGVDLRDKTALVNLDQVTHMCPLAPHSGSGTRLYVIGGNDGHYPHSLDVTESIDELLDRIPDGA